MKRYVAVLATLCALCLALAAASAFAGGLQQPTQNSTQEQSLTNNTGQGNEAGALNAPIASGNNVAVVNGGDQNSSAGTNQGQANVNGTGQSAQQSSGPSGTGSQDPSLTNNTSQGNEAGALNVPIASGNNVAVVNGGDQSSSAGTNQGQANVNGTGQSADQQSSGQSDKGWSGGGSPQEQSVTNSTDQSNGAGALNVPIASGNNVAVVNGGDQSSSAGTNQGQANVNGTGQSADQQSSGQSDKGWSGGGSPQEQSATNSTDQSNGAGALNVPIASGNNVAVVNGGDQSSSAGTNQGQANVNGTGQSADQQSGGQYDGGWAGGKDGGWNGSKDAGNASEQSLSNHTKQSNEAFAFNAPIASGNNVALFNKGGQSSSAGTDQEQGNFNWSKQHADQQSGGQYDGGWVGGKDGGWNGSKDAGNASEQSLSNHTKQSNEAFAFNAPIASGNNVALFNKGGQSSSVGTDQEQVNLNQSEQKADQSSYGKSSGKECWAGGKDGGWNGSKDAGNASEQSLSNHTKQSNEAFAFNAPIASGNNVALFNKGGQSSSAGTDQEQGNFNWSKQHADQQSGGQYDGGWVGGKDGGWNGSKDAGNASEQSLSNHTKQSNEAFAFNAPIASGNNVALFNKGGQSSSVGTDQEQVNLNQSEQKADQSSYGKSSGKECWAGGKDGGWNGSKDAGNASEQSLSNHTKQSNEAFAFNAPIASGNNVALFNKGGQSSSVGTDQEQVNLNQSEQKADQSSYGQSSGKECWDAGKNGGGLSEQSVRNQTTQSNEAGALNVPIASGNNLALFNTGDQRSSAGTDQEQLNLNASKQEAGQLA